MANPPERKICPSCGAQNPPGANKCLKCKSPFGPAKKPDVTEEEIDQLLSDIFKGETLQAPTPDGDKVEDIGLELSPDALEDEGQSTEAKPEDLLESLLLESTKEKEAQVEVFECPLCSATVPVDATKCPSCGAPFVDASESEPSVPLEAGSDVTSAELESLLDETGMESAEAEPESPIDLEEPVVETIPAAPPSRPPERKPEQAEPRPPVKVPAERAPPAVARPAQVPPVKAPVTRPAPQPTQTPPPAAVPQPRQPVQAKEMQVAEPSVPILSRFGTRLVDISLLSTVIVLLIIFLAGGLWVWENWSPVWAALLFGLGALGFGATYALHLFGNSFIVKGDQLYLEGKYSEALEQYERAVRFGSRTSSSAWTNRGNCYRHLGYPQEALRSHEIALKIDGKDEIAWANKGATLLTLGDVDGALDAYDKSLKLKPNYVVALNNKGVALANANELENAVLHFKRALEIQPRYKAAWVNLAEGFSRLGRGDESQECLSIVHRMA